MPGFNRALKQLGSTNQIRYRRLDDDDNGIQINGADVLRGIRGKTEIFAKFTEHREKTRPAGAVERLTSSY